MCVPLCVLQYVEAWALDRHGQADVLERLAVRPLHYTIPIG